MEQKDLTSVSNERFVELLAKHRDAIYGFLFSLLPNHTDAEDVFQKSSIVIWRKMSQLENEDQFLTWACAIARLEVCNFVRAAARNRLVFSDEMLDVMAEHRLEQLPSVAGQLDALRACVSRLKAVDRELIDAIYSRDAKLAEYATSHGFIPQTLYNRASKLRRQLYECVRRRLAQEALSP